MNNFPESNPNSFLQYDYIQEFTATCTDLASSSKALLLIVGCGYTVNMARHNCCYGFLQIHASNPFILLVLYHVVMCYKNSGHTTQLLDSAWSSTTIPVGKTEMAMMYFLQNRSALKPAYIKVESNRICTAWLLGSERVNLLFLYRSMQAVYLSTWVYTKL